jgi:hypothetical protein
MEHEELAAAVEPDALRASLAANAERLRGAAHAHHGGKGASVRSATYKAHEIVIHTTYEITVDGDPFDADVIVDNSGRVHYHGLPTRDFTSTVALVKKAIDLFPEDFPTEGSSSSQEQVSEQGHGGAD